MSKSSDEETSDPVIADDRNFYKVEKWTKDGAKVVACFTQATTLKERVSCSSRPSSIDRG